MCVEAPWVCHIDNKSVISHEFCQVHVAQILGMCGIVGGLLEAAGCGHVLEFFIWVFPGEVEKGWAEGPRVQGAGDHLEVICMAGEVWA